MRNEILIPKPYTGEGHGICVEYIGLDYLPYDAIEVSCDGINYYQIKADPGGPAVYQFEHLAPNTYYTIYGRVTRGRITLETSTIIPSREARMMSLQSRSVPPAGGSLGKFSALGGE